MVAIKKLKSRTQLIIISVIVLTLATMNVSYSAFFKVETDSNNVQTFTTGSVGVTASATAISSSLMPSTDYTTLTDGSTSSLTSAPHTTLTITNTGSITSIFGVTLIVNVGSNVDTGNIVIGIYDKSTNKWLTFGTQNTKYVLLSQLTQSTTNNYPIIKSEIAGTENTQKQYDIYVWLKSDTATTEIGKTANISLSVKSVPKEGQDSSNNGISDVKAS